MVSCIHYIETFGFSAQPFLTESLNTFKDALRILENRRVRPPTKLRSSDLKLEELIR